jgi:hypothetical protein
MTLNDFINVSESIVVGTKEGPEQVSYEKQYCRLETKFENGILK